MKKTALFTIFIMAIFTAAPRTLHAQQSKEISMPSTSPNAYQFSFKSIDGNPLPLSDFSGKVVLIVNTASKCGFTGQYKELQNLYETYKDKGLVILGVPSGDFAGQEFAEEESVKQFTDEKFHITFPLTEITHVKGGNAHPFYAWAKKQGGFLSGPKWNFHKYLIDRNGNFVTGFGTRTSPTHDNITTAIEVALATEASNK
ncbi:MAG: glutathione peroxidase [Alcanivorax sp.]